MKKLNIKKIIYLLISLFSLIIYSKYISSISLMGEQAFYEEFSKMDYLFFNKYSLYYRFYYFGAISINDFLWMVLFFDSLEDSQFFCTEVLDVLEQDNTLSQESYLLHFVLHYILCSLFLIIGILIAVAFFTLLERKVMAAMQRRKGPNVVGFWGLLQPLADGLKLLVKEIIVPKRSSIRFFLGSPLYTFLISLLGWCVIPWSEEVVFADPRLSALYVFAVSSLGVYGVLLAGWSSNSKYAFLGGLRSAAQMISYEVSLGFILVIVALFSGTYNLREIVYKQEDVWYCFPMFPLVLIFFVSMLAETNRAPFDLPEAEAELVSGYNTEYSSIVFAMFFLGEYSSMLLMAAIMVIFFFGGWLPPIFINFEVFDGFWFFFKVTCIAFLYVWVRATLPRYRYNQLMSIGWKIFLPITFGLLVLYAGLLLIFDGLPSYVDEGTFIVESILNLREKRDLFFQFEEFDDSKGIVYKKEYT